MSNRTMTEEPCAGVDETDDREVPRIDLALNFGYVFALVATAVSMGLWAYSILQWRNADRMLDASDYLSGRRTDDSTIADYVGYSGADYQAFAIAGTLGFFGVVALGAAVAIAVRAWDSRS